MSTLNPGYFDARNDREPGTEPACSTAAITPDAMSDDASHVAWLGLCALAITVAGAIFVG